MLCCKHLAVGLTLVENRFQMVSVWFQSQRIGQPTSLCSLYTPHPPGEVFLPKLLVKDGQGSSSQR